MFAMKPSVLLLAAFALAAGSLRAEVVDIDWSSAGRFVHSGQIPAGKFVEVCGKLPAGLRIQWEFETGSAVDFNVHYHAGSAKVSASNLSAVTRARQVFEVTSEQDYCWTWINKAGSNTLLTVTLQR